MALPLTAPLAADHPDNDPARWRRTASSAARTGASGRRRAEERDLRGGVPVPRPQGPGAPRRPGLGDAGLQRVHGGAHLPARRGLRRGRRARPGRMRAPARRPVSRVLYRGLASRRRSSIWGRRLPDGSCGRPEGWAAHLSPRRTGVAPSYLALLRVEFAAFHSGPGSGRGIVTVALVLASRRTGVTRHPALGSSDFPHAARVAPLDARPSGRLAGPRRVHVHSDAA